MRFWGNCIKIVVYLINKLPTEILEGKCPYEILHNKLAKLDNLRVFGCLCFASNLLGGDKFTARANKCVFIGYSETQKDSGLYDLDSKGDMVSKAIIFREHLFLLKKG